MKRIIISLFVFTLISVFGCMSWEEGWKQVQKPSGKGNVSILLSSAEKQINQADTKEKLLQAVKTLKSVLEIKPLHFETLWNLGRWNAFLGASYSNDVNEKKKYYIDAIKYCERAMYTNPDFKILADKGEEVLDACRALSKREVAPMNFWYYAVSCYWNECLSAPEKLLNISWTIKCKKILERMMEIDPAWAGGVPVLNLAVYYAIAPGIFGGDIKKSGELFNKAIEMGPRWLYKRYCRAKFFYTTTKDRDAFKKDLEWVISQDPYNAGSPYPANVTFQRDARFMLNNIDDYF